MRLTQERVLLFVAVAALVVTLVIGLTTQSGDGDQSAGSGPDPTPREARALDLAGLEATLVGNARTRATLQQFDAGARIAFNRTAPPGLRLRAVPVKAYGAPKLVVVLAATSSSGLSFVTRCPWVIVQNGPVEIGKIRRCTRSGYNGEQSSSELATLMRP